MIIVKFDGKTLEQSGEKTIELPEVTKNFNSEIITEFNNGNYFWIHSDWDKSSETESLYYDKLDVTRSKTNQAIIPRCLKLPGYPETLPLPAFTR